MKKEQIEACLICILDGLSRKYYQDKYDNLCFSRKKEIRKTAQGLISNL